MLDGLSHGFFGIPTAGDAERRARQADRVLKTGSGILVIPHDCPLTLDETSDPACPRFDGKFLLTGDWRFSWLDDENYELIFEPDHDSLEKLPFWKPLLTNAVDFENEDEFLATILTRPARNRLRFRRQLTVYGRATIMAEKLTTASHNGWRYFRVRFIGVVKPAADGGETAPRQNTGS